MYCRICRKLHIADGNIKNIPRLLNDFFVQTATAISRQAIERCIFIAHEFCQITLGDKHINCRIHTIFGIFTTVKAIHTATHHVNLKFRQDSQICEHRENGSDLWVISVKFINFFSEIRRTRGTSFYFVQNWKRGSSFLTIRTRGFVDGFFNNGSRRCVRNNSLLSTSNPFLRNNRWKYGFRNNRGFRNGVHLGLITLDIQIKLLCNQSYSDCHIRIMLLNFRHQFNACGAMNVFCFHCLQEQPRGLCLRE